MTKTIDVQAFAIKNRYFSNSMCNTKQKYQQSVHINLWKLFKHNRDLSKCFLYSIHSRQLRIITYLLIYFISKWNYSSWCLIKEFFGNFFVVKQWCILLIVWHNAVLSAYIHVTLISVGSQEMHWMWEEWVNNY